MLPYFLWLNFTLFEYAALSLASTYGNQVLVQTEDVDEEEDERERGVAADEQVDKSLITSGEDKNALITNGFTRTLLELKKGNLVQKTISFLLCQIGPSTTMPQQQFYYRDQSEDS